MSTDTTLNTERELTTNAAHALDLAAKGWSVFPCRHEPVYDGEGNVIVGAKTPLTAHGFKDATTDIAQVGAWWDANPDALVGVAPGAAGFTVVDVDDKPAEGKFGTQSLDVAGIDLPATFAAPSLSGTGQHHWYKGVRSSANGYLKDVDIKSEGGYVVAPYLLPSVEAISTADLPAAFTVERKSEKTPYTGSKRQWLADHRGDISGKLQRFIDRLPAPGDEWTRDQMLRAQVFVVKCGAEGETGAADALETIEAIYLTSPWDTIEYQTSWDTALAGAIRDHGGELPEVEEEEDEDDLLPLLSIDQLLDRPDPEWWIDNLLMEGSTAILAGKEGTGKSFIALDMCIAIANGQPWFGRQVRQGKVLYVAGEGGRGFSKRVRAWQQVNGPINTDNFLFNEEGVNLSDPKSVERIKRTIRVHMPDVIVLDTFSQLANVEEENSASQVSVVLNTIRDIRMVNPLATVVVVHHANKSERGSVRGSSAMTANADTVIIATKKDPEKDDSPFSINTGGSHGKQKDGEPMKMEGFVLQKVVLDSGKTSAVLARESGEDEQTRMLLEALADGQWHSLGDIAGDDPNLRRKLKDRADKHPDIEHNGGEKRGSKYRRTDVDIPF